MKLFLYLLILSVATSLMFAQPSTITYQGKLLDVNGIPVNQNNVAFTFAIYDASTGGNKIWPPNNAAATKSLNVNVGLYSTTLGTGSGNDEAFASSIFNGITPYLEVTVAGTALTRTTLSSVPFSLSSNQASNLSKSGDMTIETTGGNGNITINPNGSGKIILEKGVQYNVGTSLNGKVLTSDANGNASWAINSSAPVTSVAGKTGVVTLTTADVAASTDKNYVTDGKIVVIGNTSGTNSGDNAVNSLYSGLTNYTHPTGDGNLHVPATSNTNNGKVLTAGATAGSLSWTSAAAGDIVNGGNAVAVTIGTTTDYALAFKVNGQKAGEISSGTNTSFGINTLIFNTGGANTANGYMSLFSNTTGYDNTANGLQALSSNTTGYDNTATGNWALSSNTTGSSNTANGLEALASNTTGNSNTATGNWALSSNTTGFYNTANGYLALSSNTTGFDNTANGYLALYSNTTGAFNTANGFSALYSNTTSSANTANGNEALYSNTTGGGNTATGYQALYSNTTGGSNTATGNWALSSNTTGYQNTADGVEALKNNTTGFYNTANGFQALLSNTTGYQNTANGYQALSTNTTGSSNTANGLQALYSNTTGNSNTANGCQALYFNTTGGVNTANGIKTLYSNTTGDCNTANGFAALYSNTTGFYNTANGNEALYSNTTGYYNSTNGNNSLYSNTTGYYNTANGNNSLYSNTTGFENTANGYQALYSNTTGYYNTANGVGALYSNTGYYNTANGYGALYSNTTGVQNTANGYNAGRYITDGSTGNATSSNSVYLGAFTKALADGGTNQIVIGYNATGAGSNTVTLGNTSITSTVLQGAIASSTGASLTLAGVWTDASDARLKTDIKPSKYGLNEVMKLKPVNYNMIKTGDAQVGFIAQDVMKIIPEVVSGKEGDLAKGETLGLSYGNLVPVLTKAMQEQQATIVNQGEAIKQLQKELAELKKELATAQNLNQSMLEKFVKLTAKLSELLGEKNNVVKTANK